MPNPHPITCQIRYQLDLTKLAEFEAYGRAWVILIERYGGTSHGYFIPRTAPVSAQISFPGIGHDGPNDIALALFTFPTEQAYHLYRQLVAADPDCQSAEALYRDTQCFLRYERLFLQPVDRSA